MLRFKLKENKNLQFKRKEKNYNLRYLKINKQEIEHSASQWVEKINKVI